MIDATNDRLVVAWSMNDDAAPDEVRSNLALAAWLAEVQGLEFGGAYDPLAHASRRLYWVPTQTLVGPAMLKRTGVHGPLDLFGGYVEHAFIASKAIAHPLVQRPSAVPKGWNATFAERVRDVVLDGCTVFRRSDAMRAGSARLAEGPLRLKPVGACGGHGQRVAKDADELAEALDGYDDVLLEEGLVLEQDLAEVDTHSVGQVLINGFLMSYHGHQSQASQASGESVYGGSDLLLVRGDFDSLLALDLAAEVRLAIEQARIFDVAAHQQFPRFFASRRNYDIARGIDHRGRRRSGVLEQSWRIGGASSAEIAALEAFVADPGLHAVRASSFETRQDKTLPPGAREIYRGSDAAGGFLLKYAMVETHVSD
ncbi:DUF3182 family protein [Pseudomonas jinjuensis]|uniref:Biotin carboxylase n=1 Tax=Pseudomonas jinjuensis TaxID=198616 RepID=A0A1H0CYW3_9PSED|nr:DUF3182 family protein [Pseudomonas jinjuensis]SDN63092.1 Protein of unknown function [Pseudomonas jinjuensis]